jgi:hypothetical protein
MKTETAQTLVAAIDNALTMALDARNRIKALEKERPSLYSAYQKELKEVRKKPPLSLSSEGLSNLRAALVQDTH